MAISAEDKNFLVSLYVGYFNRAPDPAGLQFWIDQVEAGRDTNTIAADFAASPEAKSLYPFLTTPDVSSPTSFITAVYANLFNRAPDAAGQAFWEQQLSSGAVSPADAIDAIIKGATTAPDSTILANKNTVGLDFATDAGNTPGFTFDLNGASGSAATSAISGVTEDASTVIAAQAATDAYLNGVAGVGETLTLTTGVDAITATANNDLILAGENNGAATLTAGDVIDGGAGTDTLKVAATAAIAGTVFAGKTISNVEAIELLSGGTVTADTSSIAGVTSLSATGAGGNVDLTAAATTDVSVSGQSAAGTVQVEGGKDITVTNATGAVEIGDTTAAEGTVTVTDTSVANDNIHVDAKGDVTITATGSTGGGNIEVGDTTASAGAINVTSTSAATPATVTLSAIETNGGTTVTVAQSADTTNAATDTAADTVTMGAVDVDAGNTTTTVTVTQSEAVAAVNAQTAVAAANQTHVVTFSALNAGEFATVNGLTFTAAKNLTADQVASAFANLANADTQSGTGPVANGIYTNQSNTANFTSGAASGSTVTFTEVTAGTNAALAIAGTAGKVATAVTTAGTAATPGVTGVMGVVSGSVDIDDNATSSITDVTVDGYGALAIGTNTALGSLTNLSLANSGASAATVTTTGVSALALTLNDVDGAVNITDAAVKTLNITGATTASTSAMTANGVETLTVAGDQAISLTADLAALKTVTVTGTAGLTLAAASGDTITSVDTTGTTGKVTTNLDAGVGTYTGGAGVDTVTLETTTALTKAIDLGAGDDTLSFGALGVTGSSATLSGGDGIDTLSMAGAAAEALDGSAQSFYTNFEKLSISTDAAGAVDVKNLGFASNVTLAAAFSQQLSNLASGATVELTTAGNTVTLQVENANTNASDVLNLVTNVTATDINFGTVTAADVETVNITADDKLADDNNDGTVSAAEAPVEEATIDLDAANAKTVTVSGSADINLDLAGTAAATTVNASSLTGALTATAGNNGMTVTGGSGADQITVTGDSVTVNTGAGKDTIVINGGADLLQINGGDGADTFDFDGVSSNDSNFTVINGIGSGDLIDLQGLAGGVSSFSTTAITLSPGATETTQAFLDQAMVNLAAGEAGWFNTGGNTFIVVDAGAESTTNFVDAQDFVVMLAGTLDLSTGASFNSVTDTLEII